VTDTVTASPQENTDATATDGVTKPEAEATGAEAQNQQAPVEGKEGEAPKGDEQTKPEAGKDGKEDAAPTGAPEAYEDFAAPEGVELDAAVLDEFKGAAKELNLSQAQAQSVVDLGIKLQQSFTEKALEAADATITSWEEAAKTDKEIGGEAFEKNLALAKKATDTFGSEAFKAELLEKYRLGSHPEFIRFAASVAKAISEDTLVPASGEGAPSPREFGASFYKQPQS
jgi:hypothetical protein